jgi:hypothetical protein
MEPDFESHTVCRINSPNKLSIYSQGGGAMAKQARLERIGQNRLVKSSEINQQFCFKDFQNEFFCLIDTLRSTATEVRYSGAGRESKAALAELIIVANKMLKEKFELRTMISEIHERLFFAIKIILDHKEADTGLVMNALSLLETISYQTCKGSVAEAILCFCFEYIYILANIASPSLAINYMTYFSNILANSIMSVESINEITMEPLIAYFKLTLNLLRLKKSALLCKSSLWSIRALILRFSPHNPSNPLHAIKTMQSFGAALHELRLDEVCTLSLAFVKDNNQGSLQLLTEILFLIAFATKHFESTAALYSKTLFERLAEALLNNNRLLTEEPIILPYLAYLAGVVSNCTSERLLEIAGNLNATIVSSLVSLLVTQGVGRRIQREILVVLYNYLVKGLSPAAEDQICSAILKDSRYITDDYFSKEVLHICFWYIQKQLKLKDDMTSEVGTYVIQIAKNKMPECKFNADELYYLNQHYDEVIKALRTKSLLNMAGSTQNSSSENLQIRAQASSQSNNFFQ